MRWSVEDPHRPDVIAFRLTLDGIEERAVTAFDNVEGWVDCLCTGEIDGHPNKPHVDYDTVGAIGDICRAPRKFGKVRVVPVGGRRRRLAPLW